MKTQALRLSGVGLALVLYCLNLPTRALACVVGTGTGTCTEAALNACLPGGVSFDGTMTFNCGGAATITVTSTKTISADTTIDGGGLITISGGHSVGVFHSNNVNFTVQNLIIANGEAANGGGIRNEAGALTVTKCVFSDNSVTEYGGGIYSGAGGTLTVTNTTFSGNTAGTDVLGGGSGGGGGGGIANVNSAGTLTVTNSTFSGNIADTTRAGGGIYSGAGGTVTVTNTTFSGNVAGGSGGGICNQSGTLAVTNSTFSGNIADADGYPGQDGGGICNCAGTATVTNTVIANSTAGNCCSCTPIIDGGHNIDDGATCGVTGTGCTTTTGTSFCNTNPLLDPSGLQSSGGGTQTIALCTGVGAPNAGCTAASPAINVGDESVCSMTTGNAPVNNLDQRGYFRPGAGATNCSIGAYEANGRGAWPMFRHDPQHTGLSPVDTSANPGTQKWAFNTDGPVHSSPAIGADGTIYVGYGVESGGTSNASLYAINPDGTPKWAFATANTVHSSPAIGSDGSIYVGSWDHLLYAINPDGTQKWAFDAGDLVSASPVIGADGTIYVGSHNRTLYAINPDGTQQWAFGTSAGTDSSPAIGADGTIYVGGGADQVLYAVNPGGTQKWAFGTGAAIYSSPAIGADGSIYVGSGDHHLYAINPDGTQKWAFAAPDAVGSSPAIGTDGTIYVGGAADPHVYAIKPDGTQKWAFATGGRVDSTPAIGADGTIYVGSDDSHLYAINPDGTQRWAFASFTGDSSPAIGADGTIFIGSANGHLYAVGGPSSLPNGQVCSGNAQCTSGFCVDGVCCNSACGGGLTSDCQACSVTAGGTVDGTCTPSSGNTCNDGDGCPADTCQAGACQPVSCPSVDAVVFGHLPLNAAIPTTRTEVAKAVAIAVRNADTVERTIALAIDASDCPALMAGAPDFIPTTLPADTSIVVPAGKVRKARLPLTIRSADFTSFNFRAPTRCTLVVTASAVVAGGSNDPNPSNNRAVIEVNVVDKHDPEQTTASGHETWVKSAGATGLVIPLTKPSATKTLRAAVVNADYRPTAEIPGDPITLSASTTCTGLTLGTPVCDPVAVSSTVTVRGGTARLCKFTATADAAQISTPNKLSLQRCTVTLTATGPTDPQTAPRDASNNSTELVIDVLDRNP